MAEAAALGLSVDSSGLVTGTAELDKFSAAADRAGKASDKVGADTKKASTGAKQLSGALAEAQAKTTAMAQASAQSVAAIKRAEVASWEEQVALRAVAVAKDQAASRAWNLAKREEVLALNSRLASVALRENAGAVSEVSRAAAVASGNLDKLQSRSKAAAFAARNLNYQIMDMAQGFALGMPPMMIMMQQLPQAADAFSMLAKESGGAGRVIASMAARFAPAIVAAAAAGTAFAALTTEINKNSEITVTWQDTALGAYDAVKAYLTETLGPAFEWLGGVMAKVWQWSIDTTKQWANFVIGTAVAVPSTIVAAWQHFPSAVAEVFVSAANLAINALQAMVNSGIGLVNSFISGVNSALGTGMSKLDPVSIPGLENKWAGSWKKLGEASGAAFTGAYRDYVGSAIEFISPFAQARARERINKDAEKAGASAGKAMGSAAAKEAVISFREAFKDIENYYKQIEGAAKETRSIRERVASIEREAQVIHLSGWAREKVLLQLEREAEITPILNKMNDARVSGQILLAEEYQRQIDLINELFGLQIQIGEFKNTQDANREATRRLNEELADMARLLGDIGGAGSVLGSLLAVASGNFGAIARGPLGDILSHVLSRDTGRTDAEGNAILLGDTLKEVFGRNGIFGQTLKENLASAGMGMAAANAFGMRSGGSQAGSAIGGLIGQEAGRKFLSSLGGFAGPLGTIAGGILGGLLGGLFGGAPKGSATLTGARITGTSGKGDQLAAANQSANSIVESLARVAQSLGGTVNAVAGISIGMRKDQYVVDPTGQGRTKGSGVIKFGQDQEAAVRYAMQSLIQRGVIGGIRDSTNNILRAGGDLEAQIQRALAFEGVFKELKATVSPFSAELREMQASFAQLTDIFREASASAEEYAQLQDFIKLKQKQLIDSAMSAYRSTFYTDSQNTSFAQSVIKATLEPFGKGNVTTVAQYKKLVEATDALAEPELFGALMELVDEFGMIQQAAENAKQAAEQQRLAQEALNAQRGQMEVELLRLQGKELEATAKARQLELAAIDASLRGLQGQIHLWQDIAAAQDVLRQAYQRERQELEGTVTALTNLSKSLKDFRDSLNAEGTGSSFAAIAARFRDVGRMAMMGDQASMGGLPEAARAYLDAAMDNASTAQDYQRALAEVRRYTDGAIGAADQGVSVAEQQLEQMKQQVGALINIDENVTTVAEVLAKLTELMTPASPTATAPLTEREEREREREERRQQREEERSNRMMGAFDRLFLKQDDMNRLWGQIAAGVVPITVRTDPLEPLEVVEP